MYKKVIGLTRTTLKTANMHDRIVNSDGRETLFKSFLVSNIVFNIKKIESCQATILNIEKLFNLEINQIANLLDQYDLIVLYSTKNKNLLNYIQSIKNKNKFLFIEESIVYRDVYRTTKAQKYIRIKFDTPFGNNFIKKYGKYKIRKNFTEPNIKTKEKFNQHILIVNQLVDDLAVYPTNPYEWALDIVSKIREQTQEKILFRDHPLQDESNKNKFLPLIKNLNVNISDNKDISDDLLNAYLCVTFSSNSCIDSLLGDTPVIACDPRSFIYELAKNDVENIFETKNFDSNPLWIAISNTHYSLPEILSGDFWINLKNFIE